MPGKKKGGTKRRVEGKSAIAPVESNTKKEKSGPETAENLRFEDPHYDVQEALDGEQAEAARGNMEDDEAGAENLEEEDQDTAQRRSRVWRPGVDPLKEGEVLFTRRC